MPVKPVRRQHVGPEVAGQHHATAALGNRLVEMLPARHAEHPVDPPLGDPVEDQVPCPPEDLVPGQLPADRRHVPVAVECPAGLLDRLQEGRRAAARCSRYSSSPKPASSPEAVGNGSQRMNGKTFFRKPLRIFRPRRSIDFPHSFGSIREAALLRVGHLPRDRLAVEAP